MSAKPKTATAAQELHAWFSNVSDLTGRSLLSLAPGEPHTSAVVLDTLARNARELVSSRIDRQGALYMPLCLFMVAACRRLRTSLSAGHWTAALENVIQLRHQLQIARAESVSVGLELGSAANILKQELDQSIIQSGLTGTSSFLDREDREIALGLSVNWAMRFLLAYAFESKVAPIKRGRRDFAWLANVVRQASRRQLDSIPK